MSNTLTRRQLGKLAGAGLGAAALAHIPHLPIVSAENGPIASTWYFAEGYTAAGFDEFLTIFNPNADPVDVRITYYLPSPNAPQQRNLTVSPNSRTTVAVHDTAYGVGRGWEVSAKVESWKQGAPSIKHGVVVERPMYFSFVGSMGTVDGGHNVRGVTVPRATWYFAEGYTGSGFDEFLSIMNPTSSSASVRIIYYYTNGATAQKSFTVGANSRYTVAVHETANGVGRNQAVSAKVESTNSVGLVVERPMYFAYGGSSFVANDGHIVVGANAPNTAWYFADGRTTTGYDEFLTIFNPNGYAVDIAVMYYLSGTTVARTLTAAANTRTTVSIHSPADTNNPGGLGRGYDPVSVKVASSLTGAGAGAGIIVERPLYFNYNGITGGNTVMGANAPRHRWYFAEGFTGTGYDEYLVIFNPNITRSWVRLNYRLTGAPPPNPKDVLINPQSTKVVAVHGDTEGVGRNGGAGWAVSVLAETFDPDAQGQVPVIIERPMYFNSGGKSGGHTAVGYVP